jgi:hypothetical protein
MYTPYQKEKKIPTLFGLFFILVLISSLGLVLDKQKKVSISAATPKLQRLEITNTTHNSTTIFWRTSERLVSWLRFGEEKNQLNEQIFDDRNVGNNRNLYFNHYVILKNLQSNKKYFFEIVTSKGLIKKGDNLPFVFITKAQLPQSTTLRPATGTIQDKTGIPLDNAIVLLKIEGTELLSDRTKEKGEWLIPLYYLTKINSNEFVQPTEDTLVILEIINETGNNSLVKAKLKQLTPLTQTIIIGKNYDFIQKKEEKVLSETSMAQPPLNNIDIIFPKENAAIPGRRPSFRGTAFPNKKIKIIIESKSSQIYEKYSDQDGIWKFTPFYDLEPGKHKLTIITEDESGKEVKVTRNFTILKSGEGVLGEATPSATLTPTVPVITLTVTPIPTEIVSPTESPPTSGISFVPLTIFGSALFVLGVGLVISF